MDINDIGRVDVDTKTLSEIFKYLDSSQFKNNLAINTTIQSIYIEYVMVRVPIPSILIDTRLGLYSWRVLTEFDRIASLYNFYNNKFKLQGLVYVPELNNYKYTELKRNFQRRLSETKIVLHCVHHGTSNSFLDYIIRNLR